MARIPAHKDNTEHFHELTDGEQAKSISAQIMNLEAAIDHRIGHTQNRQAVIDTCKSQVASLLARLQGKYP